MSLRTVRVTLVPTERDHVSEQQLDFLLFPIDEANLDLPLFECQAWLLGIRGRERQVDRLESLRHPEVS
jgi:hypothetical protein